MIKWLALVLIVANGVFWAWAQGWLGAAWPAPGERQREPQRLQQQVRPESIVVLSPRAASAALEQIAAAAVAASEPASGTAAPAEPGRGRAGVDGAPTPGGSGLPREPAGPTR